MSGDEQPQGASDESGENNDDAEERISLTPEQKEALRRTIEGVQQPRARNIDFPMSRSRNQLSRTSLPSRASPRLNKPWSPE